MKSCQHRQALILGISLGLLILMAGCHSSAPAPAAATNAPAVTIALGSSPASLTVGSTYQFNATVSNTTNTAVTWAVSGANGGDATAGTISATGLYTAPSLVPSPATVSVTATSQADETKSASATLTINILFTLNTPASTSLEVTGTEQIVATIEGTTNTVITWTVNGIAGGSSTVGTISNAGLYTAPQLPPSPSTVTINATSQAYSSMSQSVQLTITPPPISVSVSPAVLEVQLNGTMQFSAQVTTTGSIPISNAVTWGVKSPGAPGVALYGTISPNGLYTAPAMPPVGFLNPIPIYVTSQEDPTKFAVANVTITTAPVPPTVEPSSVGLAPGGSAQFSAFGTGLSISNVIWSVNGTVGGSAAVGTITPFGVYTAPPGSSAMVVNVQATFPSTNTTESATAAIIPPGTVSTTQNPLVASYSFNVPEASTVFVQFGPDTNYGLQTSSQNTPSGGGQVNIFVAGMRASSTYHMRAVAQLPDGAQFTDSDQVFTTGAVPASLVPSLTATTTPGMIPNSGIEMLDLADVYGKSSAARVVATDLNGNVIWYYDPGPGFASLIPSPIKLLPNGHILINYSNPDADYDGVDSVLEEIDLAGDVIWQMSAADLNAALAAAGYNLTVIGTHHDFAILPNGHLIVIAAQNQNFTNLIGFPGTTLVTGDVLIDLDTNHIPVWVWSEFDYLDVNRHPMAFPSDWTHTNAVLYSPSDGDLVISIRHQYWVIKIDYDNEQGSGDIVWKLGWQGDFTLVGGTDPVDWFYAQHAPAFATSNTSGTFDLTLFDNGDNRPINGSPCGSEATSPCYSTVPLFEINEPAMTATILWRDTLSLFAWFGGNAEPLPNGNVEFDECASQVTSDGASVYEVTQNASSPQTVWQMQIAGQDAYRAMRIPSLYPGVQW